jgi:hypothetical protein
MFQADLEGILALVAVLLSWALAVLLFRIGTPGSVARKLAVLLIFEGITLGSSDAFFNLLASPADVFEQYPWLSTAQHIIHHFGDCVMLALYPPFLAAALQTRFTRPFGRKRMRIGVAFLSAMLFLMAMFGPWQISMTLLYTAMSLVFVFAFVASVNAWYIATGAARSRALIFALAFGFRDFCWIIIYADGIRLMWFRPELLEGFTPPFYYIIYTLGTLFAVPLIAYGILRTQLFDIDLRIRWTIKQSTVAGVFVAVMFVISEGASQFLSDELGSVAGLLAAGVLMFFLTPLQQFAERVASVAMPNTENTPTYAAFRKMQVYEAALAEAQHEDGISDRERALLNSLRDSLDISASDARAIEAELQAAVSS